MRWYTIQGWNFKEVGSSNGQRKCIDEAVKDIKGKIKPGLIERLIPPLYQERKQMVTQAHVRKSQFNARERLGLLNFDYHGHSEFDIAHMDIYAASQEDAKKQLIEKREAIKEFFGVEVPETEEGLHVKDCVCPGFNGKGVYERISWVDNPATPPGF